MGHDRIFSGGRAAAGMAGVCPGAATSSSSFMRHTSTYAWVYRCSGGWRCLGGGCGGSRGNCSPLVSGMQGISAPCICPSFFFPTLWRPWMLWGYSCMLRGTLGGGPGGNPHPTSHPHSSSCRRVSPVAGGACRKGWFTGCCGTQWQPHTVQHCSTCSPRLWASPALLWHLLSLIAPRLLSLRWR